MEWLRKQLEDGLKRGVNPEEFARLAFKRYDEESGKRSDNIEDEQQTLRKAVIGVVSRMTQTVPGMERLVAAFDYDLGPFILFIHFVLCCLHRQNDMRLREGWKEWMEVYPFSKSRDEQPIPNGAASRALERLKVIQFLVQNLSLSKLKSSEKEIPPYDPRPDPTIRVELESLKEAIDEALKIAERTKELAITEKEKSFRIGKGDEAIINRLEEMEEKLKKAREAQKKTNDITKPIEVVEEQSVDVISENTGQADEQIDEPEITE